MKKLNLNKKVIAKLSDSEQGQIKGGLSSKRNCTGFTCCHSQATCYTVTTCGHTLAGCNVNTCGSYYAGC